MKSFSLEAKKYLPHAGFLIVVAVFVYFKVPHLSLPYFWDEAWSYATAVHAMYENGPSLLPGALPPDVSRGHPLLFYFLAASWQKLFGPSLLSSHMFALFLSVCLLAVLFYCAQKAAGKDFRFAGVACVALLCVQPLFIAQSAMLLPEVMVSLWIMLALVFYLNGNPVGFVVAATCLLFTKEPGVIFLAACGVWVLVEHFYLRRNEKFNRKDFLTEVAMIALPVVFISCFFILQKIKYGWFFFPEHIGLMEFDWKHFKEMFHKCHDYVFKHHAREPLALGFLIITITFWKALRLRERILLGFCFLAVTKIFFELWKMPRQLEYFFIPVLLVLIYDRFFFRLYKEDKFKGRLVGIAAIFGICFLAFSSVNFLSMRYVLCVMVLFILTAVVFSAHVMAPMAAFRGKADLVLGVLVVACGWNMFSKVNDSVFIADDSLNYVDGTRIQQDIVRYFEENDLRGCRIYGTFLNEVNLTNPVTGYLTKGNTFAVSGTVDAETDYFIFTNMEGSPYYEEVKKAADVQLAERFQHGKAWGEIYRRVNTTCKEN